MHVHVYTYVCIYLLLRVCMCKHAHAHTPYTFGYPHKSSSPHQFLLQDTRQQAEGGTWEIPYSCKEKKILERWSDTGKGA